MQLKLCDQRLAPLFIFFDQNLLTGDQINNIIGYIPLPKIKISYPWYSS
ncbi:hypothetical protein PLAN_150063 [Planktothrix rubescens CCAP 1459/22]|uniref:Uncharacterized protein n=1 Tax=Planktothrix rubescens CCAP 1459/22 TaxID=329571 RepID=A0A6J7ZIS9_PLARU|nr:hypothetical protein PLAN_150063 [Planktothrix rubescens NIVA-CYA 18]